MTKYKFNLNYYMYVKLTDFGKEKIIEEHGYEYFKYCIESNKQPDGYYQLQAHTVMNLLGKYLYNGARQLPFDPTVYFTDADLRVIEPENGTWIKAECSEKDGNATCSLCGHWDWSDCKYCSNCGAKMCKEPTDD